MKRAISFLLLTAALAVGCQVDVDLGGTQFTCRDGSCPDGYTCVADRCVSGDAAEDIDAAAATDATSGGGDLDADIPDAATAPDAGQLLSCDDQFGAAPSYELCTETPTSCAFFLSRDTGTTCSMVCAEFGAACLTAHDAEDTAHCTPQTEDGCDASHFSQICTCAR